MANPSFQDLADIDEHTQVLVCDGIAFLRNCGQAVRLSALHTYHSALPLTPKATYLFKCYAHKVPGIPTIVSSHPTWPAASVRVLEGHSDWVTHIVFSPDGRKLVSSSVDNTVQLWDVESGLVLAEPLLGFAESLSKSAQVHTALNAQSVHLSFDQDGFLKHGPIRLLWLPVTLRGSIAVYQSHVAIGNKSGFCIFIQGLQLYDMQ